MSEVRGSADRRLHGAWASLTLDALLDMAVQARPNRRSFTDAPDIASWSDLAAKSTTIGEFGALVRRFARQMQALALKPGDPVLVAMPNCVDGVVALLGASAAGYIPCPVSVVARAPEMQEAAEAVGAKAIVTVNRYATFRPSEEARQAASRYYGLRFVCAFGGTPPSGVVSLDDWADSELGPEAPSANAAVDTAIVTFDRAADGLVPHLRSHAQVIADALALSATSGLTGRGSIVATFAPVSAAGFAATVAAPLISGSTTALHGPFDAAVLARQLQAAADAIVVLPAAVEQDIRAALAGALKDTIVITRDLAAPRPAVAGGRVTELVTLGEAALWSLPRDPSRRRARLPRLYAHPVGTALPRTIPQIEIAMSSRGRLALAGFGVARPFSRQEGDAPAPGPLETRWLGHAEGPDHFVVKRDDADDDREGADFAVAAA